MGGTLQCVCVCVCVSPIQAWQRAAESLSLSGGPDTLTAEQRWSVGCALLGEAGDTEAMTR